MIITNYLENNARYMGRKTALVEVNPTEERDNATTWQEAHLIESAKDSPYRREITWQEFDRQANKVANLLLSRNVARGTKIGLLLMNCLEWLPAYFGILKAGCVVVPLNFRYTAEEIKYCLDLADVEILFFSDDFTDRIDAIIGDLHTKLNFFMGKNVPDYAELLPKLAYFCSHKEPPIQINEDDIAAIYFSSGTTGFPKAIVHNHKSLVASCFTEQDNHKQTEDDVFLCIPPLYHTGAKMHWFGSLVTGGKAVILRGVKPQ